MIMSRGRKRHLEPPDEPFAAFCKDSIGLVGDKATEKLSAGVRSSPRESVVEPLFVLAHPSYVPLC